MEAPESPNTLSDVPAESLKQIAEVALGDDEHSDAPQADPEGSAPVVERGDGADGGGEQSPGEPTPPPQPINEFITNPDLDPTVIDPSLLTPEKLIEYAHAARYHLMMTRELAESFDKRLVEHRRLLAAMLDAAGGRIVVNPTQMKRANPAAVRIETGFEGGECILKLDPKSRPRIWTPK